jgi:hypothetical protein
MSLAKAVPEGIRDPKCKWVTLCERPPVPSVPKKEVIQETVSALKNDQSLKTSIGEDAELPPSGIAVCMKPSHPGEYGY